MFRLHADRNICVGAGQCAMIAPGVFDQDESGLVLLISTEPGADTWETVLEAAARCPTEAISVTEDGRTPDVLSAAEARQRDVTSAGRGSTP